MAARGKGKFFQQGAQAVIKRGLGNRGSTQEKSNHAKIRESGVVTRFGNWGAVNQGEPGVTKHRDEQRIFS